ncbi:SDR family NAD(P)-dependent oxidoreductase [Parvularcula oceani]|uniref:SDR family NAD(P)-dependent oxidoreductase n=1 Tax=Parvularcula oceani TaxID=1247963 RepID=UPI0004E23360|nr:SDR family oxidoreductase [Parvularcula oceani]
MTKPDLARPLSGRTVLVTGASRGIGAATARICAAQGASVLLHYGRGRDEAEGIASEIGMPPAHVLGADLSQPGAGGQLWEKAVKVAPGLDCLVNNAGIYEPCPLTASEAEWAQGWAKTMAVNVQAVADLSRAATLHFTRGTGGALVNIASRAAQRGDDADHAHYAASKGAVVALTKTLARAYARHGLRAYTVAPGWVATRMARRDPSRVAQQAETVPLGRFAEPEEVGRLVAFLLSDACPSATGATFDVNGASHVR